MGHLWQVREISQTVSEDCDRNPTGMALGKLILVIDLQLINNTQELPDFEANLAQKYDGRLKQPYVKSSLDAARGKLRT